MNEDVLQLSGLAVVREGKKRLEEGEVNTGEVKNGYTERELLDVVRAEVACIGSQKKAAEAFGVGQSFLSDVMNGRRKVGPTIAQYFKLSLITTYERNREER